MFYYTTEIRCRCGSNNDGDPSDAAIVGRVLVTGKKCFNGREEYGFFNPSPSIDQLKAYQLLQIEIRNQRQASLEPGTLPQMCQNDGQ